MKCWGRGWLENRFQVIKSARNRPRQKALSRGEAGVHFHPVFTLPAYTTLASPSPPMGLSFFLLWSEGGGLGGAGFWLGSAGPSNGWDLRRGRSFL